MKITDNSAISTIVIAGSGLEAWLSAAFLQRHLGKHLQITICPVDGSDELDALYTVLPSHNDIFQSLGISNIDLVKHCNASFSLGSRYTGLSSFAVDFDQFRPYGEVGIDFLGGTFIHHWLRNKQEAGEKLTASDYFSFSPAYHAGSRGAFAPPVERSAIGSLQHQMARHVDVGLLTALLRDRMLVKGVSQASSDINEVRRSASGFIEKLVLNNGDELKAELFIDCSGKKRSLSGESFNGNHVPVALAPHYQLNIRSTPDDTKPPPYNRVSALGSGWQVTTPGNGWNNDIDLMDESKTGENLTLEPGYTSRPWSGNCLALGFAAVETLPVEALPAKILVNSLKRLVQLMPGPDCAPRETIEFNHLFEQDLKEVADISTLFELSRQKGNIDPLNIPRLEIPASLKNKLSLFSKRGWVAPLDSTLISRSDWTAVFILLGLFPNRYDRIIERMPVVKLTESLRDLKARIEKVAAEFPPHGVYLDAVKSSPGSKA